MKAEGFVVGFGGTGARVLEAALYLSASGYARKSMHMLMIDPDKSNGNVLQLRNQAAAYRAVFGHVLKASSHDRESLFSQALNPDEEDYSLAWEYPLSTQPFESTLGLQEDVVARPLYEMLYDVSDMEMQFDRGYVGRAHIGSLDMFRVLRDAAREAQNPHRLASESDGLLIFLKQVKEAAAGDGAHVVVVGSVFGGTGASGLPALPALLNKVIPDQLRGKVTITGILLAPYFGFPEGADGSPESALHPLATKASLYHYASTSVGYDRVYLVGAPSRPNTNEQNRLGGMEQRNAAHYAELAAALAIESSLGDPPSMTPAGQRVPEVNVSASGDVTWSGLPAHDLKRLQQRLAVLATFSAFHSDIHAQDLKDALHQRAKWHADLEAKTGRHLGGREAELEKLTAFSSQFMRWIGEIAEHSEVDLFKPGDRTMSKSMDTLLPGHARAGDGFHEMISGLDRAPALDANTGLGWYVRAASRSAERWCAMNYKSWWGTTQGVGNGQ